MSFPNVFRAPPLDKLSIELEEFDQATKETVQS